MSYRLASRLKPVLLLWSTARNDKSTIKCVVQDRPETRFTGEPTALHLAAAASASLNRQSRRPKRKKASIFFQHVPRQGSDESYRMSPARRHRGRPRAGPREIGRQICFSSAISRFQSTTSNFSYLGVETARRTAGRTSTRSLYPVRARASSHACVYRVTWLASSRRYPPRRRMVALLSL